VEVRFPDRRAGPYLARLEFGEVGGRLELTELTVTSVTRKRIIDGRRLRTMRLSELVAEALRHLQGDLEPGELLNAADYDEAHHQKRAEAWSDYKQLVIGSATGRRYPARHLERVANIYSEALRRQQHPTQAVAKALGISPTAAAKQVHRARALGLLKQTTQGKAEGRRAAPQKRRTKK
jgi:hypothetical protein